MVAHVKKDLKSKVDGNFEFVPGCSSAQMQK